MKASGLNGVDLTEGSFEIQKMDSEIFGFSVAEWILPQEADRVVQAQTLLEKRAAELEVRLVSCRVATDQNLMLGNIQRVGFKVVDCLVTVGLRNLQRTPVDDAPLALREAIESDVTELEKIAGSSFQTGRYHLDPLFPRALADKRYQIWVRNALTGRMPGSVLVAEDKGEIAGFIVQRIEGDKCEGQLACVNPKFKNKMVMYSLLAAHTAWLRPRRIRKTTGRISIGLMQAINLNLALHAELRRADYVLHWHSSQHPLPQVDFAART